MRRASFVVVVVYKRQLNAARRRNLLAVWLYEKSQPYLYGMQTIFTQELPNMQPVELLLGKIRYSIPDLDKKARDLGARALMSGLRGGADLVDRAASVLTTGALSSQGRFASGLFVNGISSFIDILRATEPVSTCH